MSQSDPDNTNAADPTESPADGPTVKAAIGSTANVEAQHDDHEEFGIEEVHPIMWWLTLVGPFLLTGVVLAFLAVVSDFDVIKLFGHAIATFFLFGRFAIIALAGKEEQGITMTAEQLFFMVMYMDTMVAMLLSCHLGFMFKLPFLGPKMKELVVDGKYILGKNPWMEKVTYIGIVAFVMFPLAATGSVGGSIFGRLLGLTRTSTFICVIIGSFLGCGSMYLLASVIEPLMQSWEAKVLGIGVIIAIIFLLNRRYQKMKSMHLAETAAQAKASSQSASPPSSDASTQAAQAE